MRRAITAAALLIVVLLFSAVSAQSPFEIRIFVDNENLTVYVPSSGLVSLRGFGFQVQVNNQPRTFLLESYAAFGIPFDQLPAPLCFRLRRSGSAIPLPIACNGVITLTQDLTPADVFWFDGVAGVSRAILLVQNGAPFSICPSGANECAATFTPPTYTPTPEIPPTPTPYPRFEGTNTDWTPQITTINGIDVALVPPGCFTMGSADFEDAPPHEQCIDAPYSIGVTEVTNAQYARCVDAGVCTPPEDQTYFADRVYADHPVVNVDWFQARDFAEWWGGRLPTEREWEYAARGVESWDYPWGDVWDATRLNFCDQNCALEWQDVNANDGFARTASVGSFPDGASWVGALDMSGNVWEWTSSLYMDYPYDPEDGREADTGDRTDVLRCMRGGSWHETQGSARAVVRSRLNPYYWYDSVDFRVVSSPSF